MKLAGVRVDIMQANDKKEAAVKSENYQLAEVCACMCMYVCVCVAVTRAHLVLIDCSVLILILNVIGSNNISSCTISLTKEY